MRVLLRTDREFRFDVERASAWSAIERTDEYRAWWPWLREFDGTELTAGARWICVVKPPLPYRLRFVITLTEVIDGELIRARISGDLTGTAELRLFDDDGGCTLHLDSQLELTHGPLRLVAWLVRPVLAYGHRWVLDTGARQFADRALHS